MLDFFKNLFGKSVDYKDLKSRGAQIIDVRTTTEFQNGHIKQSQNIPLQDLKLASEKLDLKKPIITCCASGVRSASAKSILQNAGFEVYNGGGWQSLQKKLNS